MQLLDLSLKTPEENLACDEALLELLENDQLPETLRFWESPVYFTVLGYSNKARQETYFERCCENKIPVLRRPSGGGTVLQGPGCLNYSLTLKIPNSGPLTSLTQTNAYVLEKNRQALETLLPGAQVQGISDLTFHRLKFSGNAQRRKKNALLFHGTFLWNFDLAKISEFLAFPSKQPDYRQDRAHEKFVTNIPLTPVEIKEALKKIWSAKEVLEKIPREEIQSLIQEKYSREDWNLKY